MYTQCIYVLYILLSYMEVYRFSRCVYVNIYRYYNTQLHKKDKFIYVEKHEDIVETEAWSASNSESQKIRKQSTFLIYGYWDRTKEKHWTAFKFIIYFNFLLFYCSITVFPIFPLHSLLTFPTPPPTFKPAFKFKLHTTTPLKIIKVL